jgi:hypothetical protein
VWVRSSPGAGSPPTLGWSPVLVTKHFYEQQIAPKRRFFAPPGSECMFKQEGETMQMVLSSAEVAVDLADYRIATKSAHSVISLRSNNPAAF